MVEILLLHRHLPFAAVVDGIRAALTVGSTSPELVAVEARRAATGPTAGHEEHCDEGGDGDDQRACVLTLPVTGPAKDPGTSPARRSQARSRLRTGWRTD